MNLFYNVVNYGKKIFGYGTDLSPNNSSTNKTSQIGQGNIGKNDEFSNDEFSILNLATWENFVKGFKLWVNDGNAQIAFGFDHQRDLINQKKAKIKEACGGSEHLIVIYDLLLPHIQMQIKKLIDSAELGDLHWSISYIEYFADVKSFIKEFASTLNPLIEINLLVGLENLALKANCKQNQGSPFECILSMCSVNMRDSLQRINFSIIEKCNGEISVLEKERNNLPINMKQARAGLDKKIQKIVDTQINPELIHLKPLTQLLFPKNENDLYLPESTEQFRQIVWSILSSFIPKFYLSLDSLYKQTVIDSTKEKEWKQEIESKLALKDSSFLDKLSESGLRFFLSSSSYMLREQLAKLLSSLDKEQDEKLVNSGKIAVTSEVIEKVLNSKNKDVQMLFKPLVNVINSNFLYIIVQTLRMIENKGEIQENFVEELIQGLHIPKALENLYPTARKELADFIKVYIGDIAQTIQDLAQVKEKASEDAKDNPQIIKISESIVKEVERKILEITGKKDADSDELCKQIAEMIQHYIPDFKFENSKEVMAWINTHLAMGSTSKVTTLLLSIKEAIQGSIIEALLKIHHSQTEPTQKFLTSFLNRATELSTGPFSETEKKEWEELIVIRKQMVEIEGKFSAFESTIKQFASLKEDEKEIVLTQKEYYRLGEEVKQEELKLTEAKNNLLKESIVLIGGDSDLSQIRKLISAKDNLKHLSLEQIQAITEFLPLQRNFEEKKKQAELAKEAYKRDVSQEDYWLNLQKEFNKEIDKYAQALVLLKEKGVKTNGDDFDVALAKTYLEQKERVSHLSDVQKECIFAYLSQETLINDLKKQHAQVKSEYKNTKATLSTETLTGKIVKAFRDQRQELQNLRDLEKKFENKSREFNQFINGLIKLIGMDNLGKSLPKIISRFAPYIEKPLNKHLGLFVIDNAAIFMLLREKNSDLEKLKTIMNHNVLFINVIQELSKKIVSYLGHEKMVSAVGQIVAKHFPDLSEWMKTEFQDLVQSDQALFLQIVLDSFLVRITLQIAESDPKNFMKKLLKMVYETAKETESPHIPLFKFFGIESSSDLVKTYGIPSGYENDLFDYLKVEIKNYHQLNTFLYDDTTRKEEFSKQLEQIFVSKTFTRIDEINQNLKNLGATLLDVSQRKSKDDLLQEIENMRKISSEIKTKLNSELAEIRKNSLSLIARVSNYVRSVFSRTKTETEVQTDSKQVIYKKLRALEKIKEQIDELESTISLSYIKSDENDFKFRSRLGERASAFLKALTGKGLIEFAGKYFGESENGINKNGAELLVEQLRGLLKDEANGKESSPLAKILLEWLDANEKTLMNEFNDLFSQFAPVKRDEDLKILRAQLGTWLENFLYTPLTNGIIYLIKHEDKKFDVALVTKLFKGISDNFQTIEMSTIINKVGGKEVLDISPYYYAKMVELQKMDPEMNSNFYGALDFLTVIPFKNVADEIFKNIHADENFHKINNPQSYEIFKHLNNPKSWNKSNYEVVMRKLAEWAENPDLSEKVLVEEFENMEVFRNEAGELIKGAFSSNKEAEIKWLYGEGAGGRSLVEKIRAAKKNDEDKMKELYQSWSKEIMTIFYPKGTVDNLSHFNDEAYELLEKHLLTLVFPLLASLLSPSNIKEHALNGLNSFANSLEHPFEENLNEDFVSEGTDNYDELEQVAENVYGNLWNLWSTPLKNIPGLRSSLNKSVVNSLAQGMRNLVKEGKFVENQLDSLFVSQKEFFLKDRHPLTAQEKAEIEEFDPNKLKQANGRVTKALCKYFIYSQFRPLVNRWRESLDVLGMSLNARKQLEKIFKYTIGALIDFIVSIMILIPAKILERMTTRNGERLGVYNNAKINENLVLSSLLTVARSYAAVYNELKQKEKLTQDKKLEKEVNDLLFPQKNDSEALVEKNESEAPLENKEMKNDSDKNVIVKEEDNSPKVEEENVLKEEEDSPKIENDSHGNDEFYGANEGEDLKLDISDYKDVTTEESSEGEDTSENIQQSFNNLLNDEFSANQ